MSAPETGVQLVRAEDGTRSTTAVTKGVVADALRAVDPAAADAALAARDWRSSYLEHVVAVTAAGARRAQDSVAVARAGVQAVADRVVFVDGEREQPLAEALAAGGQPALGTTEVRGTGERVTSLRVPYRGQVLEGDALLRQLDAWVEAGTVEPSFRTAVGLVVAHPEWLDLSDRAVAVLGAGAEMGPLEALVGWGAHVLAVDVPDERVWRRVLRTAEAGAGTVSAPAVDGVPGADVLQQTPALATWLAEAAGSLPLTVGSYAYADGGTHVRLAAAGDALLVELLRRGTDVGYAELATPTDAFVVPAEVVEEARRRWAARGVKGLLQAPARRLGLFAQAYREDLQTEDGRTVGIADSLVPQQGPNYAVAKRLQRWRALVGRADGVPVSANVAPATRTRSVTKNRVLAAAYAGAGRFGVEVFEPATSRALLAAMLVHDLRAPAAPLAHPDDLFVEGAAHGGFWRVPYAPRSVLTLAAAAGAPGLLLGR